MDKQFDPHSQMEQVFAELDVKLHELAAIAERMKWLRERVAAEYAAARDRAEAIETFTEEQAAEIFHVKKTHLADLRRQHNLPHCKFGDFVRYTRQQLLEVADRLAINRRSGGQPSAVSSQLKRAA